MEGRDFDLPPDDQIPNLIRSRRNTWRSGGWTQVLHSDVEDGQSPTNDKHRRTASSGRTHWKAWKGTSWRLQAKSNNQDWHPHQLDGPPSINNFSQRKPRCICLESWRHAKNRPFGHGAQVECVALLSTHPSEETGVCPIMRPSYSGRSSQVTRSELYQGSLLPRLAGKRHDGQESQCEMKDVRGLHKPEQSIPQR